MTPRFVVELLVGSAVVYLVAASCSATAGGPGGTPTASAGKYGAVPDAEAQSSASPTVVSTTCSKSYVGSDGVSYYYAEVEFPGRSATDLARAVVITTSQMATSLPGYGSVVGAGFAVSDGKVALYCGPQSPSFPFPEQLRFVLP